MQICLSIMQTVKFVMQYTCIKEDVRTSACVCVGGDCTCVFVYRLCSSSCIIYSEARSFSCTISCIFCCVCSLLSACWFLFFWAYVCICQTERKHRHFCLVQECIIHSPPESMMMWVSVCAPVCSETLRWLLSDESLVIVVDSLQITPPTKTHTSCLDLFISGEVNVFPGVCEQQEEVGGWDWRRVRQFASEHLLCQLSAALQYYRESVSQHTFPLETIFVSLFFSDVFMFFAAQLFLHTLCYFGR